MSHPSLSITCFLVYGAKRRLRGTVMDLLCCGYADWIDGLTVYSLVLQLTGLINYQWTYTEPPQQSEQLFRQTCIRQKNTKTKCISAKQGKGVKERATGGVSKLSSGIILIEGVVNKVHALKQSGG